MSIYSATILLQREKEEGRIPNYRYRVMGQAPHPFITLILNVLQEKASHFSTWILDNNLKEGLSIWIFVYTPNGFINNNPRSKTISFGQYTLKTPRSNLEKPKIPIIHVVLTDVFGENLYKNQKLHHSIPRYFQITDSSIWNYYVPMVKFDNKDDSFYARFTNAVNNICENYKNDLYKLEVAREYADVNARIVRQSRLCGNHALGVAPHIFHSESAIEKLIETGFFELKEEFKEKDGKSTMALWRFLLVDDNAIGEDGTMKNNCKLSIIMRLIEKALFPGKSNWVQYRLLEQKEGKLYFSKRDINKNAKIVIDCVQKYDDAVKALKKMKYDLILLDYLLDLKGEQRKFGYELLEKVNQSVKIKNQFERFRYLIDYSSNEDKAHALRELISKEIVFHNTENQELISFIQSIKVDDHNITQNLITNNNIEGLLETIQTEIEKEPFQIGPCGKLFFIFISAYSTAVNERLLAQGLNRSEDHWYINTGACPTNTPQLFTYNLLHSMNKRLNDCGILKLSIDRILELVAKIFRTYDKKDDKKDSVRKRASLYYHKVLTLQYHYRKMLDDVEIPPNYDIQPESIFDIKKSVLISHYNEHQHLSGLLEHLTNLVHIAAFGTIRQWDEMWEEYLYFKAQFKEVIRRERKVDNEDVKIANIFQRVCDNIESFILGLKLQQR